MRILYHKDFEKSYKKFSKNIREQFKIRLRLLVEDPYNPLLSNHALHGQLRGLRSINVTGDVRAVYKIISKDAMEFRLFDTHGSLY